MVKKGGDGGVIARSRDLVQDKKIAEISDLRDESDGRTGMRLVIELKRDANPNVVLNKLYKHTPLQSTFGVNMVALVDNVPRTLPLREVIQQLRPAPARGHRPPLEVRAAHARGRRCTVLEGLLIALDHLDAVIELIRSSPDRDTARTGLMEKLRPHADPGPGDPRAAPAAADRAGGGHDPPRARRQGRAHRASCASCSATRAGARRSSRRSSRDHRALRRRAPDADRAVRGRDRHRGPDPRRADGHHDHRTRATSRRCSSTPTATSGAAASA